MEMKWKRKKSAMYDCPSFFVIFLVGGEGLLKN